MRILPPFAAPSPPLAAAVVISLSGVAQTGASRSPPPPSYPEHRSLSSSLASRADERVPQRLGVGRAAVQLEAILAGVAGPRHEALHAGDLALGKVVVRDHRHAEARELTDQRFGLWSLHREQRSLVRNVAQPDISAGLLRDNVVPILLNVRRVHDHHQLVFEAIDETVVDERPVLGENA